jgi:hypothetical protein
MSTSKNDKSGAREAKRAKFSEKKEPRGASPLVLVVGLVVVIAIIGATAFALIGPSLSDASAPDAEFVSSDLDVQRTGSQGLLVSAATHGHEPYPLVVAENGAVRLPISDFDDMTAHHFTYVHEGHPIEFFVLKSNDGVVRAAFNACDVCFGSKKGYTQDGDHMICNNCGRRFPADQINVVHGGCNPSPLGRVVEGDTLVIKVEDIIAGQGYF